MDDDPHRYDDIIGLPHPSPRGHMRMTLENRAAQFSPFAALVGYDAAIRETARLTDRRIELGEDERLALDAKLQLLQSSLGQRPEAAITYFLPDEKKRGGAYIVAAGRVKKVDEYARVIVMESGETIPMDEVICVEGEAFKAI